MPTSKQPTADSTMRPYPHYEINVTDHSIYNVTLEAGVKTAEAQQRVAADITPFVFMLKRLIVSCSPGSSYKDYVAYIQEVNRLWVLDRRELALLAAIMMEPFMQNTSVVGGSMPTTEYITTTDASMLNENDMLYIESARAHTQTTLIDLYSNEFVIYENEDRTTWPSCDKLRERIRDRTKALALWYNSIIKEGLTYRTSPQYEKRRKELLLLFAHLYQVKYYRDDPVVSSTKEEFSEFFNLETLVVVDFNV